MATCIFYFGSSILSGAYASLLLTYALGGLAPARTVRTSAMLNSAGNIRADWIFEHSSQGITCICLSWLYSMASIT